jgi:hypothetical protein
MRWQRTINRVGHGRTRFGPLLHSFLAVSVYILRSTESLLQDLRFSRHWLWTYLLLGCDAVKSGAFVPTFRRNLSIFSEMSLYITWRHVPDMVIVIFFSFCADTNTPCYRPDIPAWPQRYASTQIRGRRRFDSLSLSLSPSLSVGETI